MAALHATCVLVHCGKYADAPTQVAASALDSVALAMAEAASSPGQFRLVCDSPAAQLLRDVDSLVAGRPAAEPVVIAFVGHTSAGVPGQDLAWVGTDGETVSVAELLAAARRRRGPKVPIIAVTYATNVPSSTTLSRPNATTFVAWKPTRVVNAASATLSGRTPDVFLQGLCQSMAERHRFSTAVANLSAICSDDGGDVAVVESTLMCDFHVFGSAQQQQQALDFDVAVEGSAFDCIGCFAGDGGDDDDTRSAQTFGKSLKRLVQDDRVLPLEEFELRQVKHHVAAHRDRATLFVTGVLALAPPLDADQESPESRHDQGLRTFAVARSGGGGGWVEAAPEGGAHQLPPLAVLVAVSGPTRAATSLRVNPQCFNAAWIEAPPAPATTKPTTSSSSSSSSSFLPTVPNGVASVAALLERGIPLAVVLGALGVPTFGRFEPAFWAPFHFSRARVGKYIDLNWSAALRPELRGAPEALKTQVRAGLGRLIDGSDWLDCEQLAAEHVATFIVPEWGAAFISRIRRQQHKRMTLSKFLWLLKGGHQKPLRDISPDVSCAQQ